MYKFFCLDNLKGRVEEIDFFRGVAMILVFLQHCGCVAGKYILAFHMPLFFVLSGYLFSYNNTANKSNFKTYLCKNFKRILIPYFVFELINLILSLILRNSDISIMIALKSIILCINMEGYNGIILRLWFLPCIFICNIILYFLVKCLKNKKILLFLSSICLFIVSYLIYISPLKRLPFTIDIALLGSSFMLLGYVFCVFFDSLILKKITPSKIVVMFSCLFLLYIFTNINDMPFYMYMNQYGNYLYAILGAISGCIASSIIIRILLELLNKLKLYWVKNYIVWIGQNTLILFPVHLLLIYAITNFLIQFQIFHWLILFVILLIVIIPIINIINKITNHV